MSRYYYAYDEFRSDCKKLTEKIDFDFDTIVAIARGGMTLAHLLGEHYDVRDVYTVNTIGYDDNEKLEKTEIFNIPELKNAKNILIVDDIVDSGDTMKLVLETMSQKYPGKSFKTAALFYKPAAVIKPDWYIKEPDEWIDFFWSADLETRN